MPSSPDGATGCSGGSTRAPCRAPNGGTALNNDFNHAILEETAHRPWPLPDAPWLMTQTWHDLLFAHWPVDAERLRDKVPAVFPIDVFEEAAWIGIVPFRMTNVAPRGVPSMP